MFFAADLLLVLFPFLYLRVFDKIKGVRESLRALGLFFRSPAEDIKATILLFLAFILLSMLLSAVFSVLGVNDLWKMDSVIIGVKNQHIYIAAYLILVGAFSEEVFFRGFLVRKMGIWAPAALFALVHVPYGSLAEVLGAFALGALGGAAYRANKNIIPNIFAHIGYNLVAISGLV